MTALRWLDEAKQLLNTAMLHLKEKQLDQALDCVRVSRTKTQRARTLIRVQARRLRKTPPRTKTSPPPCSDCHGPRSWVRSYQTVARCEACGTDSSS